MIEPGIGTEKYKIGSSFNELGINLDNVFEIEDREILRVYKTKEIWFFINANTEKLDQLSLFNPFNEKVLGKIGIGDPLYKVHELFGQCVINHSVHEPKSTFGIAFETEKGSKSKNVKIESISVSEPFAFYG